MMTTHVHMLRTVTGMLLSLSAYTRRPAPRRDTDAVDTAQAPDKSMLHPRGIYDVLNGVAGVT